MGSLSNCAGDSVLREPRGPKTIHRTFRPEQSSLLCSPRVSRLVVVGGVVLCDALCDAHRLELGCAIGCMRSAIAECRLSQDCGP